MKLPNHEQCNVSIIGLGYVGLPLAIEFAKTNNEDFFIKKSINRKVIGFDINKKRVKELKHGRDLTNEIDENLLKKLNKLSGQTLHAKTLEFSHPKNNKWLCFNSDLPNEFKNILNLLENLTD